MSEAITLRVLGGGSEIGANSYFLGLGSGAGVLLDAGTHPKLHGAEALPAFEGAGDVDVEAILVSHAHLDHVGALPVALRRFPRARVYMTGPSSLLAIRMLRNAASLSRHTRDRRGVEPLFTHDHVEWVEQVVWAQDSDEPFELHWAPGRPRVTFLGAGHLLGAVGLLVEHHGRRVFYSGDTCATAQYICGPARYPRGPVDALVMDSTHGADEEGPASRESRAFGRSMTELGQFICAVAGRGGSVLMPVFAMGRAQEMLGVLHELRRRGRIPALPIYLSGLAHAVGRIYDATRRNSERRHPGLRLEELPYQVLDPAQTADPRLLDEPAIFALTSGMMNPGTGSHMLAGRVLGEPRHGVAFVGYVDPDSVGFRVANSAQDEAVDLGERVGPVRVACSVRRFAFTAHSRSGQLVETVRRMEPRRVVLVHGDDEAQQRLQERIEAHGISVERARPGGHHELVPR